MKAIRVYIHRRVWVWDDISGMPSCTSTRTLYGVVHKVEEKKNTSGLLTKFHQRGILVLMSTQEGYRLCVYFIFDDRYF
jgi:hypothetical protein